MANQRIQEVLDPRVLTAYWKERALPERQSYWGATLFPSQYTPELTLSWLTGRQNAPIALNPSSFDSRPPLRQPFAFEKIAADMPFFREAFLIKEQDAMTLAQIANGMRGEAFLAPIVNRVYEDAAELLEAARVQKEAMRMQLLSKAGKIELSGGGAAYSLEYPFPNENRFTLTGGATWDNLSTADPGRDIFNWRRAIAMRTGVWPTRIVMSPNTWQYIINNENIRNSIITMRYPNSNGNVFITPAEFEDYLRMQQQDGIYNNTQLEFKVYGEMYKPSSDSNLVPYFDDDTVALLPPGRLGYTWHSDTPENIMGVAGSSFVVSMADDGITVCQKAEDRPPLNIVTWAAMISLPSWEAMDNCGWAKVA